MECIQQWQNWNTVCLIFIETKRHAMILKTGPQYNHKHEKDKPDVNFWNYVGPILIISFFYRYHTVKSVPIIDLCLIIFTLEIELISFYILIL